MEYLYDLKEKLCKELEEYAQKSNMNAGDLEMVHKLTDTIKNVDKIVMLEEGGYSQAADMDSPSSYARGSSYANRGKHYVRGHYSRDGGYSRDGRGVKDLQYTPHYAVLLQSNFEDTLGDQGPVWRYMFWSS